MRLDEFLHIKGYFDSRTKAKQSIKRKEIYVNGELIDKSSFFVDESLYNEINIVSQKQFVSLGGYKLDKALNDFNLDVENDVCIDIGASTGGFTDCLLQRGAKLVYAVDLNDGLLHQQLKDNDKVKLLIKNAKFLTCEDFDIKPNFLCADLSFISATSVLPTFNQLLSIGNKAILLIKPQFELGVKKHLKNGIIRQEKDRVDACKKIYDCAVENGLVPLDITLAPIQKDKNIEYLILLEKTTRQAKCFEQLYKNIKF